MTRSAITYWTGCFSDGMDSTSNPRLVEATKSTDAKNIDFYVNNEYSKWSGYQKMKATTPFGSIGSYTVLGLYDYMTSGGTHYALCAGNDGNVHKMDALDGTWDSIASGKTTSALDRYNFTTLAGKVYMVNGTDAPMKWDGSSFSLVGGTPPSDASIVANCNGYVWMNSKSNPGYVYRSDFYDGDTWDVGTNFYPIDTSDGTDVKAFGVGKKILYIWKDKSLHSLNLVDSNAVSPTYRNYRLYDIGCCAQKTVARSPYGFIWFDGEKVWLWDESAYPVEISQDIRKDIESFAKNHIGRCCAVWLPEKNQYRISVPYGTVSVNNRTYVCTINNGKYKWSYFEVGANDFSILTSSGSKFLHFAESGATGYTFKSDASDTMDGVAFSGELKSKWFAPTDFGLQTDRCYLDSLQVTVSTDGNWNLKVGYEIDFELDSATYDVSQYAGGALIGSTYIIGVSEFGGSKEQTTDTKRFKGISFKRIRFVTKNDAASNPFSVKEFRIGIKGHNRP